VSSRQGTGSELACFYAGGVRTHCERWGDRWTAHRDAEGRITEITSKQHRSAIVRDARGWLTSVDGLSIEYDDRGRMTKLGEFTFEWEGDRVIRDHNPHRTATHEYDAKGRLVRMLYDERSPPRELTIRYEGSRVVGWTSDSSNVEYVYDCQ